MDSAIIMIEGNAFDDGARARQKQDAIKKLGEVEDFILITGNEYGGETLSSITSVKAAATLVEICNKTSGLIISDLKEHLGMG